MTITEMIIRTTIGFIILYTLCRLLNKKLISQMTFFDFVAGITIGSIVASSLLMHEVSIVIGMTGLILFCLYTFLTNVIAMKSLRGRKLLEDEPTYIIKDGQILEEGLRKTRMTMDNLLAHLRKKGVFYLDYVQSAILETDGTVSVLKKPQFLEAMQKDVNNVQLSRGSAEAFIIDGQILHDSLKIMGKDQEWVERILQEHNVRRVDDVFFAQIDQLGKVYLDIRKDINN
ncbi:DUF421 domain-containing protein [Bacillus alkalicellulosilyticus]|uniref:DUF421 domain-containing protein n=1 Tax=Alkalihalobacterium alkalicellulosilyticum TaxID=1912214 RepID=UPI00099847CB|nr:DUF421 domain-containing protein [Bacillus alkalicellulosilyticus]